MKKHIKRIIKHLFAWWSIELAILWPIHFTISVMRKVNGIQLTAAHLSAIAVCVKDKAPSKLLVFGLGNDSLFWLRLNRGGVTLFLEENGNWFHQMMKKSKEVTAFLVKYNTQISDWRMLLEHQSLLKMTLPNEVVKEKWDIIIIDAPEGWNDQTTGRMKSIYQSSRLIKKSGDIFVHDCNREVEDVYCNKFLKKENLKIEIKAPVGFLRHYHMTNRSTC